MNTKTVIIGIAGLAVSLGGVTVAFAESGADTVTVRTADYRGKPPFRRSIETLNVSEVAAFEADSGETVTLRTVDYSGRPPYSRRTETLPVAEVARFEASVEENSKPRSFSGRPPFKR